MALPKLSPASSVNANILPITGTASSVAAGSTTHYPFGLYVTEGTDLYDSNFITGASDQVAYTYKKLGGDVLDIELTVGNIYAAYEEAVFRIFLYC